MVTITGALEQQLRAVDSIISKLSEDPNYAQYANSPISYSSELGGRTRLLSIRVVSVIELQVRAK